eukprot:6197612-Pleurochrysis_carterae.AAC.5
MMPFRPVLPKDDADFRLNLCVERREMTKSNRSFAQRVLNAEVEADRHRRLNGGITCGRRHSTGHRYGRGVPSRCASKRCVLRGFV